MHTRMQRGYCAHEEYSGRTVYSGLAMGGLVDDKFPWFVWPLLNTPIRLLTPRDPSNQIM